VLQPQPWMPSRRPSAQYIYSMHIYRCAWDLERCAQPLARIGLHSVSAACMYMHTWVVHVHTHARAHTRTHARTHVQPQALVEASLTTGRDEVAFNDHPRQQQSWPRTKRAFWITTPNQGRGKAHHTQSKSCLVAFSDRLGSSKAGQVQNQRNVIDHNAKSRQRQGSSWAK